MSEPLKHAGDIRLLVTALRAQLKRCRGPVIVYMDRRGNIHTTVRDEPNGATVIGVYSEVPTQSQLLEDVEASMGHDK